jgi:hypothetical protein
VARMIAPIQKNHRQVVNCAETPAKKMPVKKPTGANAP